MQIQKIQNNPAFGYDAQLNARVTEKLSSAKHSKPFFSTLLKVNQLTNETENLIREAQASKNKALTYKLEDVFITLKTYIASCFDHFFPNLNYSSIEAVNYAKDITENNVKNPNHWEYNIMKILQENSQNNIKEEEEAINTILKVDKDGNMVLVDEEGNFVKEMQMDELPPELQERVIQKQKELNEMEASKEKDNEEPKINDLIEQYVPTEEEKLGFDGLVKMDELKRTLRKRVVEPLKYPEKVKLKEKEYGIKLVPTGMLLYGPPGCGKTTIAKRLAVEANVPLIMMKTGKFGTANYHGTSNNILKVYDYAKKTASPEKPVLMLFDDCDSIFTARSNKLERFESEELTTLLDAIDDGAKNNVITIGTTNRFDIMDEAVKRRLSLHVSIPLADFDTRKALITNALNSKKGQNLCHDEEAINLLAKHFDGYSNDIIIKTVKDALTNAYDESNGERDVNIDDVLKIINTDEFKNKKIDMNLYATKNSRKSVGFTK